jgi:subtilase family serine protease
MSRSRNRRAVQLMRTVALTTAAVGLPIALGATSAVASSPRVAVGSAARLPQGARFTSAVPAHRQLRLTIALRPHDASGLTAFATAVSTPRSPQYGRYLTVAQFAQRFGASSSQLAAVSSAMRAGGLRVGAPTANHLTIPVTGTVAQVQRAFSVTEAQVRLPGGRVAFGNDKAPRVQASIAADIQGVIGLDNVARPQPQGLTHPTAHAVRRARAVPHIGTGPQPCSEAISDAQGTNPGGGPGYTADEIAGAYGLSSYYPGDEGAGQSVALVEFGPYQTSDVTVFQGCYGATGTVSNVNVDGGPAAYQPGTDDDGEVTLDIDQIIGLAPKANVLVYQAPNTTSATQADILTAIASANVAKEISSSWGTCEALTPPAVISSENTSLQEMAAQGQSFSISSGDSGSLMCYQATHGTAREMDNLSVIDPGAQPFATGVGGTYMGAANGTLPDNGSYPGEQIWNDGIKTNGDASASGGGVSDQWPMPAYQASAAGGLDVIQSNSSRSCSSQFCRQVPDVSADADPNSGYVVYSNGGAGGGWNITGGTSAAAPLWAAFTALANASPACRGLTVGFENPALYGLAGSAYAANFHDITQVSPFAPTGATGNDPAAGLANPSNPNSLYPVQAGYDMGTGLGSPVGGTLGNSLCAMRAPVYTVSVANPGGQTTIKGTAVSLAVRGSDSGSATLSYGATGLPAGLSINAATGVISGKPTTAQKATVTVSAVDAFTNAGSTSFTWSVVVPGKPQLGNAHSLSGLGKGKPKLTFTVSAGSFAPALKSLTIKLPGGLSFAKRAKSLTRGIAVRAGSTKAKYTLKLKGGALTIAFKSTISKASVTVVGPAISISRSEETKIRAHKVKRLTLLLKAMDASKKTTSFSVAFKKLS